MTDEEQCKEVSTQVETKAWGEVRHIFDGPVSVSLLKVSEGGFSSIHKHVKRWNHFKVITGEIQVSTFVVFGDQHRSEDRWKLEAGETIDIPPGVLHQFKVIESGQVVEIYWTEDGSPAEKDDIIRITEGGWL